MSAARLEAAAVAQNASVLRRFVAGVAELAGCSAEQLEDLKLAVSELFAATLNPVGTTTVTAATGSDQLEIRIASAAPIDQETVEFAVVSSLFPEVQVDDTVAIFKITPEK